MSTTGKKVFVWLGLGVIAFVTYAFTIGLYPRHFDLTWDEEVQLHDGRVIVVRLKHTYERLHREFGRYTSAIPRDTELSFDAGGSTGRVTQVLKGGDPLFLDQKDGKWYLLFSWSSHWSPQLLQGQNWGPDQNGNGQHVAVLQGASFKPVSICLLPDEFQQPNFLVRYAEADELSKFDGKRVTLQDKRKYLNSYPLLPGTVRLERPSARSELACKSSSQPSQGVNK